jgi:hypothetical protein
MHKGICGVFLAAALALFGCASAETSGPPFATAAATLPPIPPGETRLFFYRQLLQYDLLAPTRVYLNNQRVGTSWIGTTFYRDVAPGVYHITVDSPGVYPNQFKTVATRAGETLYVRVIPMIDWSMLLCAQMCEIDTFAVSVENPQSAQQQMRELPLIRG